MAPKIITTRDGSRSVFSNRFQQHYHNIAGALTESRNVFFDNTGLSRALAEHRDITLCEVGFGTGLHVALLECMRKRTGSRSQVHYYSVEKFPMEGDVVRRMDFGRICAGMDEVVGQLADALYEASGGESVSVMITPEKPVQEGKVLPDMEDPSGKVAGLLEASENNEHAAHDTSTENTSSTGVTESSDPADTSYNRKPDGSSDNLKSGGSSDNPKSGGSSKKPGRTETTLPAGTPFTRVEVFRGDFHDWDLSVLNRPAQIILHDAFSPDTNPDLWTVATFRKLFEAADPYAMLGTYCSATRARAAMILAGWHIGRVQGPPGKREVTVASPDEAMLSAFKGVNEELLMNRFREELS